MRINPTNLTFGKSSYEYCDGILPNDPSALTDYLAIQTRKNTRSRNDCYTRSYEKAQRLQRLAERSRKASDRCLDR